MSDADTLTEETYPQPVAVKIKDLDKQLAKLDKKTYTPEYLAVLNVNDKDVAVKQFAELKEAKKLTPSDGSELPDEGQEDYIASPIEITDEETGEITIESAVPVAEVVSSEDYIHNPIAVETGEEDEDGEPVVEIVSATDPEVEDDEEEEDTSEAEDTQDESDEFTDEFSTPEKK